MCIRAVEKKQIVVLKKNLQYTNATTTTTNNATNATTNGNADVCTTTAANVCTSTILNSNISTVPATTNNNKVQLLVSIKAIGMVLCSQLQS